MKNTFLIITDFAILFVAGALIINGLNLEPSFRTNASIVIGFVIAVLIIYDLAERLIKSIKPRG
jgi:hypothetical protein